MLLVLLSLLFVETFHAFKPLLPGVMWQASKTTAFPSRRYRLLEKAHVDENDDTLQSPSPSPSSPSFSQNLALYRASSEASSSFAGRSTLSNRYSHTFISSSTQKLIQNQINKLLQCCTSTITTSSNEIGSSSCPNVCVTKVRCRLSFQGFSDLIIDSQALHPITPSSSNDHDQNILFTCPILIDSDADRSEKSNSKNGSPSTVSESARSTWGDIELLGLWGPRSDSTTEDPSAPATPASLLSPLKDLCEYAATSLALVIENDLLKLQLRSVSENAMATAHDIENGVFTTRTLVQLLSVRLDEEDEIGKESVFNILDQLSSIRDLAADIKSSTGPVADPASGI